MKEIWKDIEGFEKLYKISNFGNIKNKKNKILKPQINIYNYLSILLYKNRKTLQF